MQRVKVVYLAKVQRHDIGLYEYCILIDVCYKIIVMDILHTASQTQTLSGFF